MRITGRLAIATLLTVAVSACSMQNISSALSSPTSPTSSSSTTTTTTKTTVATWSSASAALPTGAGCSNFTWKLTTESSTALAGDFTMLCLGAITVSGTATGTIAGSAVTINAQGTAVGAGVPAACTFTLTANGTVSDSTLPLSYTAQTCIGTVRGTEVLRRSTPASPAPAPAPEPEPPAPPAPTPPAPPPTPVSNDAIDLSTVTVVLGPANVGSWPQTSTVTGTVSVEHSLCIYHTMLGQWPSTIFFDDPNTLVEGNQWVVANIGGRWYAGAADWYRPGQACKDVTADTIGHDAFYSPAWEPLRSWVPRVGEAFGLFATTPARMWPNMKTLDHRSNVVIAHWGQ